jgi:hypothetical protein
MATANTNLASRIHHASERRLALVAFNFETAPTSHSYSQQP